MGTRNLTIVVLNNTIRVAQYCQWDGYPEGQGKTILSFLKTANLEEFKEKVAALVEADDNYVKDLWVKCGASPASDFVNMDVSAKFEKDYPQFHRNTGADILSMIAKAKPGFAVRLDTEFAADSLFCEFAYVVDLDNSTLEFYAGFNEKPLTSEERFFFLQKEGGDRGYYPVKLVSTYSLNALPEWQQLDADLNPEANAEGAQESALRTADI